MTIQTMAYKKPYIKRRYVRKNKLAKLENKVSRVAKVLATREMKWADVAGVGASTTWAGGIGNLIGSNQGVQDFERVGDRVGVEEINFRMNGGMNGGLAAGSSNLLRVIIFRDKANGIGTTVSNVLHPGTLSTANAPLSWYNTDQRQNIEVYMDKMYKIDNVSNFQFVCNFTKKFKKPKYLEYSAGTTTVTKGQIKFLVIGTSAVANFGYNYNARVKYSDL